MIMNVPSASATTNSSSLSFNSAGSTRVPVVTVNNCHWYDGNTKMDVNNKHLAKFWKAVDQYGGGHKFTPAGCNCSKDPHFHLIDYFMACIPKAQLQQMVEQTCMSLQEAFSEPIPPTTIRELLLRFFLCTFDYHTA